MSLPQGNQGAPISQGGQNVTRTADTAAALEAGRSYVGVPTAARQYSLPPLSSVANGAQIRVSNRSAGAFAITCLGAGTDQVNDAGAPGSAVIAQNESILLVAKLAEGAAAASWFTF